LLERGAWATQIETDADLAVNGGTFILILGETRTKPVETGPGWHPLGSNIPFLGPEV